MSLLCHSTVNLLRFLLCFFSTLDSLLIRRYRIWVSQKKVFVSRPKVKLASIFKKKASQFHIQSGWHPVHCKQKCEIFDVWHKEQKVVKNWRCTGATTVVPIPIAKLRRSQRSQPIDSRPEGKPQEPLLVFFSRDNRPLNGIKLLTT